MQIKTDVKEIAPDRKDNAAAKTAATAVPIAASQKKALVIYISILFLLCNAAYFELAANKRKFVRSEISFAEQSREMIAENDLLMPYYHHMPVIDKPPLTHWGIIAGFKLFGFNTFAARIPEVIAAVATVAVVLVAGMRIFGATAGILAAALTAASAFFVEFSGLCMADMFLAFFETSAVAALYASFMDVKKRPLWFCLAAIACGLGSMTKGPVAIFFPAFCFLVFLASTRQLDVIRTRYVFVATAVLAAVALPWFVIIAAQNHMHQIYNFIFAMNLDRFAGQTFAWHYPPYYMLENLFLGGAPASIILPFAAIGSFRRWRSNAQDPAVQCEVYLWMWVALITVFFTISKGKMNYYILPAIPAAATLCAVQLKHWFETKSPAPKIIAWIYAVALIIVGIASGVASEAVIGGNIFQWGLTAGAFLAGAAITIKALLDNKLRLAFFASQAAILAGVAAFSAQFLPVLFQRSTALDYLEQLGKQTANYQLGMDTKFAGTIDWIDQGLFYTGKIPEAIDTTPKLEQFLSQSELCYALVAGDTYEKLPESLRTRLFVLQNKPYPFEKLTWSRIMKERHHLIDKVPLLLVSNKPAG